MSLLDKISFLRNLLPNLIEVLTVVIRCLKLVVDSDNVK